MNAGRMVWSKTRPRKWYSDSHLDDQAGYICEKQDYGGWLAKFSHRRVDQTEQPPMHFLIESTDIGWRSKLADAKALCDQHHHKVILASDNESLKGYVQRWPL